MQLRNNRKDADLKAASLGAARLFGDSFPEKMSFAQATRAARATREGTPEMPREGSVKDLNDPKNRRHYRRQGLIVERSPTGGWFIEFP